MKIVHFETHASSQFTGRYVTNGDSEVISTQKSWLLENKLQTTSFIECSVLIALELRTDQQQPTEIL